MSAIVISETGRGRVLCVSGEWHGGHCAWHQAGVVVKEAREIKGVRQEEMYS